MNPRSPFSTPPASASRPFLPTVFGAVLAIAVAVLAFFGLVLALAVGAALVVGLLVYALVRGRLPAFKIFKAYRRAAADGRFGQAQSGAPPFNSPFNTRPGRPASVTVVDIEAREVPDAPGAPPK